MKATLPISILFYLLASLFSLAQNNQADSLRELLNTTSEDTKRVDILNKLALLSNNSDSTLLESITMATEIGYKNGLSKAYSLLANKLTNEGKYDSALAVNLMNLGIKKPEKPTSDLVSIYSSIGLLYDYKGEYENAMSYFLEGLKLSEQLGDKKHVSDFYNRIGIIYNYRGDYDKTLEYFDKSLKLRKELNDKPGQADMYNNMGIIYRKKNDVDKAIQYYSISLNIKKELGDKASIASSYNNLGTAYFYKGEYKKSLEYYEHSLEIKTSENLTSDLASTYINIGETYTHLNDYKNGLSNINEGLRLARITGNRDDIMLAYEELSQTYAGMNRFSDAYEYRLLYGNLKDSIFSKESDERIVEMQTKYEVEKKEQEIALLQKENEIKRIEAENNTLVRNVFIIGFIIISFLIVAIVRSYRHDLAKNRQLNSNKNKIESQNEVLKSLNHEKDQLMKIVAHDLRSPLNQIDGLVNLVTYSPENLNEEQKDALASVTTATSHSRQLISKILTTKSLDPSQLKVNITNSDVSNLLQATLKDNKINLERKNIKVHFDVDSKNPKALIDVNYAEQVFENLISNALKFSPHDKSIYVKIADHLDDLLVEIRDEGPGFTEEDKKKIFGVYQKLSATPTGGETSTGLGLSIVKKYAAAINAEVWCESEQGQGAAFFVKLKKA